MKYNLSIDIREVNEDGSLGETIHVLDLEVSSVQLLQYYGAWGETNKLVWEGTSDDDE